MRRSKLPKVVLNQLEERKDGSTNWTTELLIYCLKGYIAAQETAENQFMIHQPEKKNSEKLSTKSLQRTTKWCN